MKKTRFIIGILTENKWFGGREYTFFWKLETEHEPKIGDFAIVENQNTFCMVEIVGIGETTEDKETLLTYGNGKIYKSVRYIVPRETLERRAEHGEVDKETV